MTDGVLTTNLSQMTTSLDSEVVGRIWQGARVGKPSNAFCYDIYLSGRSLDGQILASYSNPRKLHDTELKRTHLHAM